MSTTETDKDIENYDKLYYNSLLGPERPFNPAHILSELGSKPLSRIEIEIAENVFLREEIIRNRQLIERDMNPREEIDITHLDSFDYYPRNNEKSFIMRPFDKERELEEFREFQQALEVNKIAEDRMQSRGDSEECTS